MRDYGFARLVLGVWERISMHDALRIVTHYHAYIGKRLTSTLTILTN